MGENLCTQQYGESKCIRLNLNFRFRVKIKVNVQIKGKQGIKLTKVLYEKCKISTLN